MNDSKQRFYNLLNSAPGLKHLWNRDRHELEIELFERELGIMSHGMAHLAKFFAAVWFGTNKRYGFDIVDAVAYMDPMQRQIILNWISDPFWP